MSTPPDYKLERELPSAPGRYYWSEWNCVVEVGMAPPFNWRRPRHSERNALCVLPFPGFPKPIKITPKIAGYFHGPV